MLVALQRFDLRIRDCRSLKQKRHVVKALTAALRQRFNVSVSEVDHQDLWQRATIAVASVSGRGVSPSQGRQRDRGSRRYMAGGGGARGRGHGARPRGLTPVSELPGTLIIMTQGARTDRVGEEFREILAQEIPKLKDPRVGFVTVLGVKVSADLRHAWVAYTTLGDDKAKAGTRAATSIGPAPLACGHRSAGASQVPPGARVRGGHDVRAGSSNRRPDRRAAVA